MDLNADVGEGTGPDAGDDALLDTVTSASIACGFHAGDPLTMRRTVAAAARRGVAVGAHPSYPDRAGFGRRPIERTPAQIVEDVLYQAKALQAMAHAAGTRVRYVKPHGALYHRMASDVAAAEAVVEAVVALGGPGLLVPPGAAVVDVARRAGVTVAVEAFADRAYDADGTLLDRSVPGAVLTDPDVVAERAVAIAVAGTVPAIDGTVLRLQASSVCVHGDTPGALRLARAVRRALEDAGITLAPFAP